MITHKLKLISCQVLVKVLGRLFAREVRAGVAILSKRPITQRKKSLIDIYTSLDARSASFTRIEMIARRQQFRGGQAILSEILNLFLSQVFHGFSI
jgi:hypothetical protein